jgi:S1-C subfamily serine protease
LVTGVSKGGPAEHAGLRRGDLVTRLDGHKVENARDFHSIVEASSPGQDLDVEVLRGGKPEKLVARAERITDDGVQALAERLLGLSLARADGGGFRVKSVRTRSAAEKIGFQADDLVLGINGRPLDNAEALRRAVLDLQGRASALVVVQRGGGRYSVTVPLS